MYTILSTPMPRPKQNGPTRNFQFRMDAEQTKRWLEIWTRAKKRNQHINESEVNKRLTGLKAPDSDVTEDDRLYFLGPEAIERAEMVGRLRAKTRIKEVSSKKKRS